MTATYASTDDDWNYEALGPEIWSETFPTCDGQNQSPINILTACTTFQQFTPFSFSPAYNMENSFELLNTGHTIESTFDGSSSSSSALYLTGGNLIGRFEFVNFHLHWGQNSRTGSEHQV